MDDFDMDELLDALIEEVWNEPDPTIVTLADGRKVARKHYDPTIHDREMEKTENAGNTRNLRNPFLSNVVAESQQTAAESDRKLREVSYKYETCEPA
jgi:hypothetical protein